MANNGGKKGILPEQQGHKGPNASADGHRAGVVAAVRDFHRRAGRRRTQGRQSSRSSTGQVKGQMSLYGTETKDNG